MSSQTFNQSLEDARTLHENGLLKEAETAYAALLKSAPENPELVHLSAVLRFQRGQLEKALPLAEKATQLAPSQHRYLNTLGLIQRNMRQPDAALISFQIALTHNPDYAEAYANMGLVHLDKSDHTAALGCFEKALGFMPENTDLLTNYAHTLRDTGKTEEAAKVYRKVTDLAPENERYLLNVGAIEMMLDREEAALEAYQKVLEVNPTEPTALHIAAGLKGDTTAAAPDAYVASLFDVYAQDFDHHLASLAYQVPQMLGARIPAIVAPKAKPGTWHVLDLGCGTGACGLQFARPKKQMTGVDLAEKMLQKAEEHGVYDQLFKGSITDFFAQNHQMFDLVLSADVFVYIGDLSSCFSDIAKASNKGALYGFSTELATEEEPDYLLRPTGRYAHKDSYIKKLAAQNNFRVMTDKTITVRKDSKGEIPGKIYILKKG